MYMLDSLILVPALQQGIIRLVPILQITHLQFIQLFTRMNSLPNTVLCLSLFPEWSPTTVDIPADKPSTKHNNRGSHESHPKHKGSWDMHLVLVLLVVIIIISPINCNLFTQFLRFPIHRLRCTKE